MRHLSSETPRLRAVLLASLAVLATVSGCQCGTERIRRALPPGVRVDSYPQEAAGKIDVLWVIDNSGSMKPRQENLARNVRSFIDVFVKSEVDFRLAVTTTDVFTDPGALYGNPKIITPSTPDVAGKFAANAQVGVAGSPYEAGLEAAERTLNRQRTEQAAKFEGYESCALNCDKGEDPAACRKVCASSSGINFLRPDAFLYLIFLTDEEDRSQGDIRFYYRSFETAKGVGNDSTVTTAAIMGDVPTNACGATPGQRYLQLSQLTGGEVGSICDAEFAQTLENLANNAVGLRRKFRVLVAPEPQTLEVRVRYLCDVPADRLAGCANVDRSECEQVDGTPPIETASVICTPPQGGADGWAYEEEGRQIFFAGDSVPGIGSVVEIQYYEEGKAP